MPHDEAAAGGVCLATFSTKPAAPQAAHPAAAHSRTVVAAADSALLALPQELLLLIVKHAARQRATQVKLWRQCSHALAELSDHAAEAVLQERGIKLDWSPLIGHPPLLALHYSSHGVLSISGAGYDRCDGSFIVASYGVYSGPSSRTPMCAGHRGIWRHSHHDEVTIEYYDATGQWCIYVDGACFYTAHFRLSGGPSQMYGVSPAQAHSWTSWSGVYPAAGAAPTSSAHGASCVW